MSRCDLTITSVAAIVVRVLLLIWCMGLITHAHWVLYANLDMITGPVGEAFASTLGLLGVVTGFIQKHLEKSLDKISSKFTE